MEFVPATQEEVKCHINETNGAEILIAKMHQDSSEIPNMSTNEESVKFYRLILF